MNRVERATSAMYRRIRCGADWVDGAWCVVDTGRGAGTFLVEDPRVSWSIVDRTVDNAGEYRDVDVFDGKWSSCLRFLRRLHY